jgi:hypothetical protein
VTRGTCQHLGAILPWWQADFLIDNFLFMWYNKRWKRTFFITRPISVYGKAMD